MPRFSSPVDIVVHSKRHRLTDPDGASAKYAIDGIVKGKILEDDSAKYVKSIKFTQEKIGKDELESTIITLKGET